MSSSAAAGSRPPRALDRLTRALTRHKTPAGTAEVIETSQAAEVPSETQTNPPKEEVTITIAELPQEEATPKANQPTAESSASKVDDTEDNLLKRLGNLVKPTHTKQTPELTAAQQIPELSAELVAKVLASEGNNGPNGSESNPSPDSTLAERIRTLIDSLPRPAGPAKSIPSIPAPKPPARDSEGRPIPPPVPIKDQKLVALLSDATIMNGANDGPSIWSLLDRLAAPRHPAPDDETGDGGNTGGGANPPGNDIGDASAAGIMMCFPLVPTKSSSVELAHSTLVPVAVPEGRVKEVKGYGWFPWRPSKPKVEKPVEDGSDKGKGKGPDESGGDDTTQTELIWLPSKTQISFQAKWWGYRLYLPPPIMDKLNDKNIEAAKRAALITTALTWFFAHLPVAMIPPPLQGVFLLLQRLAPYLGYIGTFISWSWGTIKAYDTGMGVILTATWLLPVALIPGTWDANSVPEPPPPPPVVDTPKPDDESKPTPTVPEVPKPPPVVEQPKESPKPDEPKQTPTVPEVPKPPPTETPKPPVTEIPSKPEDNVPETGPIEGGTTPGEGEAEKPKPVEEIPDGKEKEKSKPAKGGWWRFNYGMHKPAA